MAKALTMVHPISLASGVLPEFGAPVVARAAIAAGFDAVGLWVEPDKWTDAITRETRAILADAAMPVLDVEVAWLEPGPLDEAHRRIIDIGVELGAANLLVVSSDPDDAATAAKLHLLCEHAAGQLRVALEFGMFTKVRSIGQALAILAAVDHPAAALLVDPLHLARTGAAPADVAVVDPRLLAYAQFCDAPVMGHDGSDPDLVIEEAVDLRELCGAGVLPLRELLAALPAGLPLSIELRSKALRDGWPDPLERARALAASTRAWLNP